MKKVLISFFFSHLLSLSHFFLSLSLSLMSFTSLRWKSLWSPRNRDTQVVLSKDPKLFTRLLPSKNRTIVQKFFSFFLLKERVKWLDPTKSCVIQIAISLFLREHVWHLKVFIVPAHTILFSSFPLCWWLFQRWTKLDDMQTAQCDFCLF